MRIIAGMLSGLFLSSVFLGTVYAATESAPTVEHAMVSPAQEMQATEAGTTGASMPEESMSEYILPYPGMLPDNPLYFLKRIRDSIMELLISDPTKKAEFYVLQSDKFLGMTTMLIEKGKNDLAAQTLTSSNASMQRAVSGLTDLKANGVTVPSDLTGKLKQSITKHAEVLDTMTGGISAQAVSSARAELAKLQKNAAAL